MSQAEEKKEEPEVGLVSRALVCVGACGAVTAAVVLQVADQGAHHALNCAWSIWEHRDGTNASWEDSMYKLCDFETVEEFWAYWNNIPKPR